MGWSLHYEAAMIEEQRPQAGKFFTPTSPSRASVQAVGHHVAVPGMLIAYG
jgi:hypothetical protein